MNAHDIRREFVTDELRRSHGNVVAVDRALASLRHEALNRLYLRPIGSGGYLEFTLNYGYEEPHPSPGISGAAGPSEQAPPAAPAASMPVDTTAALLGSIRGVLRARVDEAKRIHEISMEPAGSYHLGWSRGVLVEAESALAIFELMEKGVSGESMKRLASLLGSAGQFGAACGLDGPSSSTDQTLDWQGTRCSPKRIA